MSEKLVGEVQGLLRLGEVQRRVPYSRSSIYLKISRGEFPAPINVGARAVAWDERAIDDWIAARIAEGRTVAPVKTQRRKAKSRAAVTK